MTELPVRYDVSDHIATITIDRPEARNALSKPVRDGLWAGYRRFVEDDEARVAILTATGDKAFCAGGDLKEMSETQLKVPPPDFLPYLGRNVKTDKPVIAAVQWRCLCGRIFDGTNVRSVHCCRPCPFCDHRSEMVPGLALGCAVALAYSTKDRA